MVAALARSLGAEVVWRQRVRDTARETEAALESAAAAADLVVSTGGVSVGGADCVRDAVALLGEVLHWRVALKPGKPLAFGKVGTTPWLGLPGNPTSALVTFLLFAAPLIRGLQGRGEAFPQPQKIQAGFLRDGSQKREEFLRAALVDGRAELHQQQGSGVLSAAVWGDALVRVPAGHAVAYGDLVDAWTYPELLW
jgi:molybdopterin molybdotransferase